jgi:nitrogen fixation/metabolism regulation signal transduction histidine kinase
VRALTRVRRSPQSGYIRSIVRLQICQKGRGVQTPMAPTKVTEAYVTMQPKSLKDFCCCNVLKIGIGV